MRLVKTTGDEPLTASATNQITNNILTLYGQITEALGACKSLHSSLAIEETIRNSLESYYTTLADSDNAGTSTAFIEFMLDAINQALRKIIDETNPGKIDYPKRAAFAVSSLAGWFDRKEYMNLNKGISSARASRDLKQLLAGGCVSIKMRLNSSCKICKIR